MENKLFGIQWRGKFIRPHIQEHSNLRQKYWFSSYEQAYAWAIKNYKGNTDNWRVALKPHTLTSTKE